MLRQCSGPAVEETLGPAGDGLSWLLLSVFFTSILSSGFGKIVILGANICHVFVRCVFRSLASISSLVIRGV